MNRLFSAETMSHTSILLVILYIPIQSQYFIPIISPPLEKSPLNPKMHFVIPM